MIRKNSAMNYAHVLPDSDDNAVTVFLQQCVSIEETAGNYRMLLETYNNIFLKQLKVLYKILSKKGHTPTIQLTNLMNHKKLAPVILSYCSNESRSKTEPNKSWLISVNI